MEKTFGFEITISKDIKEITDKELLDLDSDAYMLEDEAIDLRKLVDKEMKRREAMKGIVERKD